jgi:hypothetical protein
MYNETDENGQYQLDCRLDSERDLEENVSIMITFAHKQLEAKVGNNFVKNRYEGYGLLSEHFGVLNKLIKDVNHGMSMLLTMLPINDIKAIDAIASIDNALAEVVSKAVQMAAEARRINDDLYHNAPLESTPLEDYMAENDGFEEVGDGAPDVSLDGQEEPESPDGTDEGLCGTDACSDGTANKSEDGDES